MTETLFFKFSKTRADAVAPTRANLNDVGFDLTVVAFEKVSDDIFRYDTGIAVQPPEGYYFDVVPRSSFSSTGYIMTNSIGVIDPEYRGSIKITLMKLSKTAAELKLPYRGFQLVLRPYFISMMAVETMLSDTSRGANGFGSSGDGRNDASVQSVKAVTFTPLATSASTNNNYIFDSAGNIYM